MYSAPVAARPRRRVIAVACASVILSSLAGASAAHAAPTASLKLQPEPAAATRAAETRATKLTYLKLGELGVSANSAVLTGKTLTVRLRARRRVELRLAVVQGKKITAFKVLTVKPGNYRLSGRLNLTPKGTGLQLRVTARIRGVRARGFVPLTYGNRPPAALGLTGATVSENRPAGTPVGTLVGLDPDFGDSLRYTLVGGAGAADNGAFRVAGNVLQTAAPLDFETRSSLSVRVRVADAAGATLEKAFTITVTDANDAPTALALAPAAVTENQPAGTTVGRLTGSDPDAGQTLSYAFATGAGDSGNASFLLLGDSLRTAAPLDHETQPTVPIRVRVTDPSGATYEQQLTVTVTDVDDAPVLTGTAGALAYTENDPATAVDPGLSVSDADNAALASATVKLTGGLEATDALLFTDTPQISGSYDAPSGTLTLTGSAPKADWQAALRAVRYRSTSDDPSTAKAVTFTVSDGTLPSAPVTRAIAVTKVNDVPTVTTSAGPLGYTENDPATAIDAGLTVTDPDSQLTGATVQITGNLVAAEDELALAAPPAGIASSYNTATGKLTLTGTASAASYQAALQAVTYRNTQSNPSNAPRTITFIASDAGGPSAPATRTVNVTPTDNAPDVDTSAGALAYTENDPATAIDTVVGITDVDSVNLTGATVQITGNYVQGEDVLALAAAAPATVTADAFDAATGRLTLHGTASIADYEAALEAVTYRNTSESPSTATRTVTYQARDAGGFGAADTHGVTVTAVDDPPAAVADSATVSEDAAPTAIPVLANDTDVDGGPQSISAVTQPANGTVVITGAGTALTYAPNANYCNTPPGTTPDTFTYSLAPGGASVTVSVAVTCVDDPPTAVDDTDTVAEDSGASAVSVLANDTDIDGGPTSVASVTQPANGTVAITGGGTGLTYAPNANSCNTPPGTTPDTFTYTLNGGASATVSMVVTCVDDGPVAVDDAATVAEDQAPTAIDVLANDPDIDGGPKLIQTTSDPVHGSVTITGGGTGLTYAPDNDYCNTAPAGAAADTFTYTVDPGGATATVAMTVTCVNDAPTDIALTPADVDEGQPSGTAVGTLSATDPDLPGDTFTYALVAGAGSADNASFTLTPGGQLTTATILNAADGPTRSIRVSVSDGQGGTFEKALTVAVNDVNNAPTDIVLTGASVAENAPVNTVVGALSDVDADPGDTPTFTLVPGAGSTDNANFNVSGTALRTSAVFDYETRASYSVRIGVDDGHGGTFERQFTITVTDADDAPTDLALGSATVAENQPGGTTVGALSSTDPDAGATHTYTLVGGAGSTDNAQFQIVGGQLQTAQPLDFETAPTRSVRIRTTDTGGLFFEKAFTITVTDANDAPVADDESFSAADSAVGNTTLVVDAPSASPQTVGGPKKTITGDILAGDSDPDGSGGLAVLAGTFPTHDGGSVTVRSDGAFTFLPAAATSCTDTSDYFDYTLTDGNTTKPPGTAATDTGRVTIAIAGCVWYVSNNASGNSGTSTAPFDTLAQAQTASATGDTIYLEDGDDTTGGYAAGLDLKAGQKLIGEAATLQVGTDTLQAADPAKRPTITDNNADVVTLASGDTVRGVGLDPQGAGGGIAGGNGTAGGSITGGTIDDVRIIDTGTAGSQPGLELSTTTGTFDVSDLTVDNSAATGATSGSIGVRLNNAGTVNFAGAGTIAITTTGAKGLDVTGTGLGTGSTFDGITVTGSGTGGVSLATTTGTTTFANLALTTTSGTTGAFVLSNAGSVTVPAAGTANVSATGGPAVDVSGTPGATLAFDSVQSAGSTADGIRLVGLGTGTFTASASSAITNAGGIDVNVDGGSGDVTYSGTITDDLGQLVRVQNTSGGTKTFGGAITDGGDGDGAGIALTSNTGTGIRFDGGLTLATGVNPAFVATGGGTVTVTDPAAANNTIATTTAAALNVVNTTIGASGLTFERISVNGAPSGIVLNGTGSAGGLTVTGNGGTCTIATPTCTGGQIQNTTGDAISLTSTKAPSFTRMRVNDNAGNGLLAAGVSALTIDGSIFVSNSDDIATSNEANLRLQDLTGTSSVTNSVFLQARVGEVYWTPTSGSGTLTWTNNAVGPDVAGELGPGLLLKPTGTAVSTLNVSGGSFAGINGDALATSGEDTSNTTVNVTGGTTFTDSNSGTNFGVNEDADLTFNVTGSTFLRSASHALQMIVNENTTGASQVTGKALNNTIGNGTADSGSHDANGISYDLEGGAHVALNVSGNTIRNTDMQGIFIQSVRFPSGTTTAGPFVDLTLRDNSVTQIDDNSAFPFGLQYGTQVEARRVSSMCLDIGNNTSTGIGGAQGFRVRQRDTATFQLKGFSGDGTNDAAVASFITGANDAGSSASVTHTTGFTNGNCATVP